MPVLRIVTEIQAAPETCFDLSRSIDLHLESMIVSQERAVAGVTSGLIGYGEEVTWEARHLGRRWRMTSRITEFDPPRRFIGHEEHLHQEEGRGMTRAGQRRRDGWRFTYSSASFGGAQASQASTTASRRARLPTASSWINTPA